MSKPIIPDRRLGRAAAEFHRRVFAAYGGPLKLCSLCGKAGATDAAHVIPRSQLGILRYARIEFGVPAHRACHERQERGEIDFSPFIRRRAVEAHNEIAKVPLER